MKFYFFGFTLFNRKTLIFTRAFIRIDKQEIKFYRMEKITFETDLHKARYLESKTLSHCELLLCFTFVYTDPKFPFFFLRSKLLLFQA